MAEYLLIKKHPDMFILIFKLIFITVCFVWGIKIATEPGMILDKLGEWGEKKIEEGYKIFDALLTCPFCMSSVYTSFSYGIGYLLGVVTSWHDLVAYPIVVCGSSMIGGIIWQFFQLIIRVSRYFDFLNRETD